MRYLPWKSRTLQGTIPTILKARVPETTAISIRSYKTIVRLFLLAMVGTHVFFLWRVRERIARGDPDFTVFYTAGKILRQGRGADLYDPLTQQSVQQQFTRDSDIRRGPLPFIHPPFEALLFLPLTFFSYRVAFALWNTANLGLLVALACLARRSVSCLRSVAWWDLLLFALAFFPIFATFHQGQDAILLLLVVVLGFRALQGGADFKAGCWLGFGIFKYHLILPLVVILALWRSRKFALGFIAVAGCLLMISLALVGWHVAEYPAFAWRIVSNPGFGGIPPRQLPNLLGLLAGWPTLEKAGLPLQAFVLACAAGLLIVVAWLRRSAADKRLFALCFSSALIAALLVAYSTNTYDLALLLLPIALVADYCIRELPQQPSVRLKIFLPVLPLLISPLWFFLWLRWERINLIAIFLVWWVLALRAEILRASAGATAPSAVSAVH